MPTGQDLVDAARELLGASYRWWTPGALIPMWLSDGMGDPPPADHIQQVGIECSDLINYALQRCGLPAIGGTQAFYDYLYDCSSWYDPNSPGEVGAVAVQGYVDESDQGHICLFTGGPNGDDGHTVIQAITTAGVTEAYTDSQTCLWPECRFQIYARLPGVDYGGTPTPTPAPLPTPPPQPPVPNWVAVNKHGALVVNGKDWAGGWYDRNWRWMGPDWD